MKSLLRVFCVALAVLSLLSCGGDVERRREQGVVCLVNRYCYEIILPGGTRWYCQEVDSTGRVKNLFVEGMKADSNLNLLIGSAVFIDERGTLLTSSTVTSPEVIIDRIKNNPLNFVASINEQCETAIEYMANRIDTLEARKKICYSDDFDGYEYVSESRLVRIEHMQEECFNKQQYYRLMLKLINDFGDDISRLKISYVCEMGLIYNGDTVVNVRDALRKSPCSPVYTYKGVPELSLVRLNNEQTPDSAFIYSMVGMPPAIPTFWSKHYSSDDIQREPLKKGDKLTARGFNTAKGMNRSVAKNQTVEVTVKSDKADSFSELSGIADINGWAFTDNDDILRGINFTYVKNGKHYNKCVTDTALTRFMKSFTVVN